MPRPSPMKRNMAREMADYTKRRDELITGGVRFFKNAFGKATDSFEHAQRNIPPAIERLKENFRKIKKHTSR